ncbi:hypothetical protein D3C75_1090000 [compost metagenome]
MQRLTGEIEARDFLHLKVDFRAQQRTFGALQFFLEELVEGHVHEGWFVVMIRRIGQQRNTHLIAQNLRIEFADQLIGEHGAADPATDDENMVCHTHASLRTKP